jgi:diamine N-acetyltransferase
MMAITLVQVNSDNWWDTLQLSVHPEQLPFVAAYAPIAAFALAKAFIRPEGMVLTPYAIYAEGQLVGFIELGCKPESDHSCWLYHFFIDQMHQGKGYGKQALSVFIQLVQENDALCQELRLSVHPDNHAAVGLYRRLGFQPNGEAMDNGELVYALRISQRE